MLLSGESYEMGGQMKDVLEGYTQFHHFNRRELNLIEALRTLRMLHHAAWLAKRWQDPAFPIAFPWFGEPRYWEDLILGLREQLGRMQEHPTCTTYSEINVVLFIFCIILTCRDICRFAEMPCLMNIQGSW